MALIEIINDQSRKASFIESCTMLIDQQVAAKNGMSGLALKTAYKVVKGVGPTYIPGAVGRLLPQLFNAPRSPYGWKGCRPGTP